MSIRIRSVNGTVVALCGARSVPKEGDIYLDDAAHHALSAKFSQDFASMGFIEPCDYPEYAIMEAEESNNPNREWWDSVYAAGQDTP